MSFILDHRQKIVDSCRPADRDEAIRLWHDIKGVKFGNVIQLGLAGNFTLAAYQIPEDASYLIIMRVECYTLSFVAAAPDFGQFGPPPAPAFAFWEYADVALGFGTEYRTTPRLPIHLLCDSEELLFAKGGSRATLTAELPANPDANARFVRTLVYAYMVGPLIADKIGVAELTYFGA